MYFKQFYLGCLAHASYLIGSNGEAIVVDPQRDVDGYIAEADAHNLKIKYVIETHLHADFVSGHTELAARTNAQIIVSEKAKATYAHRAVVEGDEIKIGSVRVQILETPGHTPESISLRITDDANADELPKVLTGDTLFVGDVGRPDLVGADGYTAGAMAEMLYESLHEKLLTLEDATEVYPAHGAGSLCGRNISKENSSTIGKERAGNYALRQMSKGDFVGMMTGNLPEIPRYFPMDRNINRKGARRLEDLPQPSALDASEVKKLTSDDYVLLDVRDAEAFGHSHVPRSINIGLRGQFATWAGSLIAPDKKIIIIADDERQVREAVTRLARVGLETVAGYLAGGLAAWRDANFEVNSVPQISVNELHARLEKSDEREAQSGNNSDNNAAAQIQIIDVRRPAEYVDAHVPHAVNLTLSRIADEADKLDSSLPSYVICAGGYRSSAAASLLTQKGFRHLFNVTGGTTAWIEAGFETTKTDS